MKSLQIKNYKNLKDFKIDSLARVNLIVGKNNVGKSTLLEAISIFAAGGDVNCLKDILDIRGEGTKFPYNTENAIEKEIDCFSSLYSERDIEKFYIAPIQFISDISSNLFQLEHNIELKLVKFIEIRETDNTGEMTFSRKFLEHGSEADMDESNASTGLMSFNGAKKSLYTFNGGRRRAPIEKVIPYEYVRTSQITSDKNPQLFDKIALTSLEKEIISALRIIEPKVDAINFLKDEVMRSSSRDEDRVPIVVFPMSSKRYKLSSMGDGVNRILTIILALLNCKDGILLIDEFENGLHYTVQTQLWKMVYQLAEKLNVQVFATTHSDDCIKSFVEADSNQLGKLIRLENRDGNIVSIGYDEKDELDYISKSNLEIR